MRCLRQPSPEAFTDDCHEHVDITLRIISAKRNADSKTVLRNIDVVVNEEG